MAFFDDFKAKAKDLTQVGAAKAKDLSQVGAAKAKDLSQAGAAKAKELTEIAKLNMASSSEEDAIRKAFIELGKAYYEGHGTEPEASVAEICEKITASKAVIEENRLKIEEIKSAAGQPEVAESAVEIEVPFEEVTESQD